MSNKTKLKIGEFSKLMQVTVKTLRHYELKGLLLPDEVDEWTGYRYYSIDQMQKLQTIRDLQRLGFSLDEIRDLYEGDSFTPDVRQMDAKIKETERQLKKLIARRNQLLEWRDSRKQIKTMEKFSIQTLPEIIVASHREVIRQLFTEYFHNVDEDVDSRFAKILFISRGALAVEKETATYNDVDPLESGLFVMLKYTHVFAVDPTTHPSDCIWKVADGYTEDYYGNSFSFDVYGNDLMDYIEGCAA